MKFSIYGRHPKYPYLLISIDGEVFDVLLWRHRKVSSTQKRRKITVKGWHLIISRAMVEIFIEPIPVTLEVDHKNENSIDDRLENLQLLSPELNKRKSLAHRQAVKDKISASKRRKTNECNSRWL